MPVVSPPQAALAWADRLYANLSPLPQESPGFACGRAYAAYRRVLRKYPASRANVGVGNCLMLRGLYREAALAYGRSPLTREARRREAIAAAAGRLAPGRRILRVAPAPGPEGGWIALAGKVKAVDEGGWLDKEVSSVGAFLFRVESGRARPIGVEQAVVPPDRHTVDDAPPRNVDLYFSRLTRTGPPVAIVYTDWPGADNDTNEQRLFRVTPSGLTPLARFSGKWATCILPPTRSHGLLLSVVATWKVWWGDLYEWDGRRFAFANRRHPGFYPLSERPLRLSGLEHSYPAWLKWASALLIHGRRREALNALRRAERECRGAVRAGDRPDSDYYTAGFYGDDTVNLQEIRRRIRWVRRNEMDHALLYRPYDFDLQVPPYRLGPQRTGRR